MFSPLVPVGWQGITAVVELLLLAGIVIDALRNRRERLHRKRTERFQLYTYFWEKYDRILKELPLDVFEPSFQVKPESREALLISLRSYFDLCAQEYFMYTQGAIDKDVWGLWSRGMLACLELPVFRESYQTLNVAMSYPEFHAWILLETEVDL